MSNPCPICAYELGEETLCRQCGWEVKLYLDMTEESKAILRRQLEEARAAWAARRYRAEPPEEGELQRDTFEYPEEFKQRIEKRAYLAGEGRLLKDRYDIKTGHFPVEIDWSDWVDVLGELSASGFIELERDEAKALYVAGELHSIYVWLSTKNDDELELVRFELVHEQQVLPLVLQGSVRRTSIIEKEFKDSEFAPQMVRIHAGQFEMGGNQHNDEKPIHTVNIAYDFAMGKYPVTFEEYDAYCEAVGINKPSDKKGWGRGKRPVINVSWHDAVAYCEWLSEQTGQQYRLPSEAEWEYACRAGTTTEYWWGNEMDDARCWYDNNSGSNTHPVDEAEGQHTNPWGLVDMSGNVWEWTASEFANSYNGNETKILSKNDASRPVLRGGSWVNKPSRVRSADRNGSTASNRNSSIGFRLARM